MIFGSVCSGIEAASCAWEPLGWKSAFFSEIEKYPARLLQHYYPDTPNYGDMTKFKEWPDHAIDLLVGGTPCQSFSVAGLRKGLDDPRGDLMLTYLAIAKRYRPRWVVWENVPGVLSSNDGRDFAAFLSGLGQCGYGWAYRVLDAQYFGVAQRRRRVFVVGHLGNWQRAAAVLFERQSLQWYPAPRRETGEEVAGTITKSTYDGGASGKPDGAQVNHFVADVSMCLNAGAMGRIDAESETLISFHGAQDPCVSGEISNALGTNNGLEACAMVKSTVRRLTPLECERLQGFPDGYTAISGASDSARYKALGNSMAVPVMRWIGERIMSVDEVAKQV